MPARGLLLTCIIVALCVVGATRPAVGEDVLRPPRGSGSGTAGTLADLGEKALERLPWDTTIVRANLSSERPVAVVACYLMRKDLLVVSQSGLVYCMSRRDLTPRWVSALKAPLAAVPAEGPTHYTFLVKACDASYWVQAWSKRSGAENAGFPARLPFAASSGITNNAAYVWIGSLGSPKNNLTLESVNLTNGRPGWGWRTRGVLWASPGVDASGNSLIIAGEDGTVTSLTTGGMTAQVNWRTNVKGAVTTTPALSPEHVIVGSHDGTLRCLDIASGEVTWLEGIDAPIRTPPWVLGKSDTITRPAGVEGAPDVEVEAFTGIAFARNRNGLYAFDLRMGTKLFHDQAERRPVCLTDKYVLTIDSTRTLVFRDRTDEHKAKARLGLQMFDLVPTNTVDGAIFGCTHDGGIVAAIPAP